MVLVSYTLANHVSILQTKFGNREGHEARRVGLETMPLDQHIEGRHGERQARLKRRPTPMHHLLQMADQSQHREHHLHQQAVLPLAPLTQFEIARIAFRGMEAGITQDNHALLKLPNQPLNWLQVLTITITPLNSCEKTEQRAVRASAAHGPENMAITRISVSYAGSESHALFLAHRSRLRRLP